MDCEFTKVFVVKNWYLILVLKVFGKQNTIFRINKQGASGVLENTGILLKYTVNEGLTPINISGGPLAYKYEFQVATAAVYFMLILKKKYLFSIP